MSRVATQLGESETAVARALPTATTAVLASLVSKANDAGVMRQIFDLVMNRDNEARRRTTSARRSVAPPNVKIGGYTDNTGDPAATEQLSQARAESVMQALTTKGIAAKRLAPEGYGDQHPVADNATEEGRAKNRRIALRVTAK